MHGWGSNQSAAWIFYFGGAICALTFKLYSYYRNGAKIGRITRVVIKEWFFEESKENLISWMTTIAVVWFVGVYYIGEIDFKIIPFLKGIPVHISFAFFLGILAEIAAPAFAKWILSKIPGGAQ